MVGRDFIGVHQMLDPQIELVRAMMDETAERMATLGVSPNGLPGAFVKSRTWDDYSLGRAGTALHLAALDAAYDEVVSNHRDAISSAGDLDPITEDMLIGHTARLELFQWFMRAHLEDGSGRLHEPGRKSTDAKAGKPGSVGGGWITSLILGVVGAIVGGLVVAGIYGAITGRNKSNAWLFAWRWGLQPCRQLGGRALHGLHRS